MTKYEINAKGQLLVDIEEVFKETCPERYTRYNGGWIKSVVRVDKTKTDGFSLVGGFLEKRIQWVSPGVYVNCSKGGSQKHQTRKYTAFTMSKEGEVKVIGTVDDMKDWAVRLWEPIEKVMGSPRKSENHLAIFADKELVAEMKRRGYRCEKA